MDATHYDEDPWFCKVSGSKEKAISNAANVNYIPQVPSSADPRIKAAVLIAPLGKFFTEASLKNIKVPVRICIAGRDDVLIPQFHADFLASNIPGAEAIAIHNGGHFMMVSKMSVEASINGSEINADAPGFDRATAIAEASKQLPIWFAKVMPK